MTHIQERPSTCGSSQAATMISKSSQDIAKNVISDISSLTANSIMPNSITALLSTGNSSRRISRMQHTSQRKTLRSTGSIDLKKD